jgi:hypothetical protein
MQEFLSEGIEVVKLRRGRPSRLLKGSREKLRGQVERKRRRVTNKSRGETLIVRGLCKEKSGW